MTIDERLDRLVERHEALTQSVEMLVQETRELRELHHKNETDIAALVAAVTALVTVVQAHEDRLNRMDGGEPE